MVRPAGRPADDNGSMHPAGMRGPRVETQTRTRSHSHDCHTGSTRGHTALLAAVGWVAVGQWKRKQTPSALPLKKDT